MSDEDIVVDDLYDGYELTFAGDEFVDVHCTRCEKDIGSMDISNVENYDEAPLLGRLVELHKEVGVE